MVFLKIALIPLNNLSIAMGQIRAEYHSHNTEAQRHCENWMVNHSLASIMNTKHC